MYEINTFGMLNLKIVCLKLNFMKYREFFPELPKV